MGKGIMARTLFYPYEFLLEVPSNFLVRHPGGEAVVQVTRRLNPVWAVDFDNAFILGDDSIGSIVLKSDIEAPGPNSIYFTMWKQPMKEINEIEPPQNVNGFINLGIIDPREGEPIIYGMRKYTEITIYHEVEDVQQITESDQNLFEDFLDYFVQAYRQVFSDYRVYDFRLAQLTLFSFVGTSEYTQEELLLPFRERVSRERELSMNPSATFPSAPGSGVPTGVQEATKALGMFVYEGTLVTVSRQFYAKAYESAFFREDFRYGVVEAISALEITNEDERVTLHKYITDQLPKILASVSPEELEIIDKADSARKLRNEIVHHGKFVNKSESQEAVLAVGKLLDLMVKKGMKV